MRRRYLVVWSEERVVAGYKLGRVRHVRGPFDAKCEAYLLISTLRKRGIEAGLQPVDGDDEVVVTQGE